MIHSEPHTEPVIVQVSEARTAVVRGQDVALADLTSFYDAAFAALGEVLAERNLTPVGPAFGLMTRPPTETMDLEVGFAIDHPLEGAHTASSGVVVEPSILPEGTTAAASHLGAYDALGDAWEAFMAWIAEQGYAPQLPFWEVYVTEPSPDADPASMRTDLFVPVAKNAGVA
ncbi:GyrI-like domain-containing protein [Zhihengliuella halotolerans]|uniref:Effector-binding domain-containing protein n=1 Tax=Zhihengliuella halotolerans TaxID=370736 RepID=A0A4Q8AH80_9MICC|nr:GyrI-like domain-containing protein [Zhihengliuella halotolerans]RZU63113.1 effector-binding domain-containing protein [Zhihengliuella halotolerans]